MDKGLTPKQKRLIREQKQQKQDEKKKVRLLERPQTIKKLPRQQENPDSIMQYNMEWCDNQADLEGTWSWRQNRQWSKQDWEDIIKPSVDVLSNPTWADIYAQTTGLGHRKHHDMEVSQICNEAQKRWQDIGLEEYDTVFRFRFSSNQRLWGYKIVHKFKIVWWDPYHKIYPIDT
jgi:hypothetical protein